MQLKSLPEIVAATPLQMTPTRPESPSDADPLRVNSALGTIEADGQSDTIGPALSRLRITLVFSDVSCIVHGHTIYGQ